MKIICVLILTLLSLTACLKDPEYHQWDVSIKVTGVADLPMENYSGVKVSLFNQLKGYTIEKELADEGHVVFENVEPGFYNASVAHSFSEMGKVIHLNGFRVLDVLGNVEDTIELTLARTNALVIKEFYFSGSLTIAEKAYNSDQFVEIYNNSALIQYADGLSLVEHESYATGDNIWSHIRDSIVVKMIWTIPGSGFDVPVAPGQSIVLATDGINHKDDPNGNPNSPVNMGDADFEFFVASDNNLDLDAAAVANLEENFFVYRGKDVAFIISGGSAIALVKIPGNSFNERQAYIQQHLIPKTSASGSFKTYFAKIANNHVLDAVEVVRDEAHAIYKRFPVQLDAGFTFVPSGSRSGKCIRRKIEKREGERVIYQDSNNSSQDFLTDVVPQPKVYE